MQLRAVENVWSARKNRHRLPMWRATETRTRRMPLASVAVPRSVIGCLEDEMRRRWLVGRVRSGVADGAAATTSVWGVLLEPE